MSDQLSFSRQPELKRPSLVIGWTVDAAGLGAKVTDYLDRKLDGQSFGEIEPLGFFPLGGVTIENDLVGFPQSKFYACPKHDLVIFTSDPPNYQWYRFLNLILDAAERYRVNEIYIVGGMVTLSSHTTPRQLMSTFNSPELKQALRHYNLAGEWDYETSPGQRPTLNSFLLWVAKRRNIPAVSLWVPIPFYLVATADPQAQKKVLEFFNQRFALDIDLSDLDEKIRRQNELIVEARSRFPTVDEAIRRLETNLRLSAEENQRLVEEIEKFLRQKRG